MAERTRSKSFPGFRTTGWRALYHEILCVTLVPVMLRYEQRNLACEHISVLPFGAEHVLPMAVSSQSHDLLKNMFAGLCLV